ncbi:MAG: hypothetical protein ACREH4_06455 [Vitreimonas sp.]
MSERLYKLGELGITEAAARALMKGRAVVVPTPSWAPRSVFEADSVISEPGELEWGDVAFFAYEQMVAATPFGMANVPKRADA